MSTVGLIAVPLVISLLIDYRLFVRMFFPQDKKNKRVRWELFQMLNWISSSIFTLSMTHLLSTGGLRSLRQMALSFDNRLALVLAFLSVTYLVGFFGVSLAVHDISRTSSREVSSRKGLTSYVPPAYYLGVVAYVWYLDTSLTVRSLVCISTTLFFAALHLSRQVSYSLAAAKLVSTSPSVPFMEKSSLDAPKENRKSELFKLYSAEPQVSTSHYYRQLRYDLGVYVLPVTAAAICFPVLRPVAHLVSVLFTVFIPLYMYFAAKVYFQPTPPEPRHLAADRLTSYPHNGAFVSGWFRLADSDEIPSGRVKYIPALGRHFALFRGEDKVLRCIDAHCVHLGANMAIGGKVVNNCLQCPFHLWSFDGTGQCTDIPYTQQIPAQAKTRSYHVCEYYGQILVWYHHSDAPPSHYPPAIAKIDRGDMVLKGSVMTEVNMHINEFAENSTDFMHFDPLHGRLVIPFTPLEIPGFTINHRPDWKEGTGEESHMCRFFDNADLSFCGMHMPDTAAQAVITFVGPAGVVFFTFDTPIGSIILFQMHTPLEPLRLNTAFRSVSVEQPC